MPYSTEWEPRVVIWTFWGVVTGEELLRSNQEIYGDERFDALAFQIVDLTDVESFEVSRDDMMVLAATDRAASRSNGDVRIAVAAHDELIRELSRCYEEATLLSPWQHRVFDSLAEARGWIRENLRS